VLLDNNTIDASSFSLFPVPSVSWCFLSLIFDEILSTSVGHVRLLSFAAHQERRARSSIRGGRSHKESASFEGALKHLQTVTANNMCGVHLSDLAQCQQTPAHVVHSRVDHFSEQCQFVTFD
jgi:hypothetical protein